MGTLFLFLSLYMSSRQDPVAGYPANFISGSYVNFNVVWRFWTLFVSGYNWQLDRDLGATRKEVQSVTYTTNWISYSTNSNPEVDLIVISVKVLKGTVHRFFSNPVAATVDFIVSRISPKSSTKNGNGTVGPIRYIDSSGNRARRKSEKKRKPKTWAVDGSLDPPNKFGKQTL